MKDRRDALASIGRIGWGVLAVVTLAVILQPLNARIIRQIIVIAVPLVLGGAAILLWKHRFFRILPLLPLLAALLVVILPGRTPDILRLQHRYVAQLTTFENVPYVWGGESRAGIDCSGLVRQALKSAALREGLLTFNSRLLRTAFGIWWRDFPAKELRGENPLLTNKILEAESINTLDEELILPGDLAVTTDGVHVLAFIGDGEWIEADPTVGKVIRVKTPVEENEWFEKPVVLVRWKIFNSLRK